MKIELDLNEEDVENIIKWFGCQTWHDTKGIIDKYNLGLDIDSIEKSLNKLFNQL